MNRLHLIGLTGHPGAGKDTSAAALRRHGFVPVAFADALRAEICQAWRVDPRIFSDRVIKEQPLHSLAIGMCQSVEFLRWAIDRALPFETMRSPRWVMQKWGSDFRRGQDIDYWVRLVRVWIRHAYGAGRRHVVITDVRMVNEAELVRNLGGYIVRVHRPGLGDRIVGEPGHESERHEQLRSDAVIHNTGNLAELQDECTRVLLQLGLLAATAEGV